MRMAKALLYGRNNMCASADRNGTAKAKALKLLDTYVEETSSGATTRTQTKQSQASTRSNHHKMRLTKAVSNKIRAFRKRQLGDRNGTAKAKALKLLDMYVEDASTSDAAKKQLIRPAPDHDLVVGMEGKSGAIPSCRRLMVIAHPDKQHNQDTHNLKGHALEFMKALVKIMKHGKMPTTTTIVPTYCMNEIGRSTSTLEESEEDLFYPVSFEGYIPQIV